jgi:hypothetical protein
MRRATGRWLHWCPGCEETHQLPDSWTFDGNIEKPTFTPSFKHSGMRTVTVDGKWTGEWVQDANGSCVPFVCHYILTAGVLNFCSDSTHTLAGKAILLPPLPAWLRDLSDNDDC